MRIASEIDEVSSLLRERCEYSESSEHERKNYKQNLKNRGSLLTGIESATLRTKINELRREIQKRETHGHCLMRKVL